MKIQSVADLLGEFGSLKGYRNNGGFCNRKRYILECEKLKLRSGKGGNGVRPQIRCDEYIGNSV